MENEIQNIKNLLTEAKEESKESKEHEREEIYKKAMDVLSRGDKILNQQQHQSIGMTVRQMFYELEMAWLAISTRKKTDNAISDYYIPMAYEKMLSFMRRVNATLFEGGDWWDFMDADEDAEPTPIQVFKRKKIFGKHLDKSQIVASIKQSNEYGLRMGTIIQETVPCDDEEVYMYKSIGTDGVLKDKTKAVASKLIKSRYIDIMDLYITDPYCEDLDTQEFGVLKEFTYGQLKRLEKKGVYENVDEIKNNSYTNPFRLSDSFRSLRRELLKFDDSNTNTTDGKVKGYGEASKYVIADVWYRKPEVVTLFDYNPETGKDEETSKEIDCWWVVSICGNAVLRERRALDLYGINKHPYRVWKFEYRRGEFYGWGMLHRLLKTQWLQNQIFNLGIDGVIKKLNGNFFVSSRIKGDIDAQIKGGMKSGAMIAVPQVTGLGLRDVILPIEYPDPTNLFLTASDYLDNVYSKTTKSTAAMAGQPTHSQLDRTAAAYQQAAGESNTDIKDVVYSLQENLIQPIIVQCYMIVSRTMWKKILVDRKYDNETQKFMALWGKPEDMYGLPEINVYGGSMYMEKQKQTQELMETLNFIQANAKFGENVNYEAMLQKFLDLKGIDIDVIRQKSPVEIIQGMVQQGIPVAELKQMVDQFAAIEQQQIEEAQAGQQIQAQQQFIHQVNVDKSFRNAQAEAAKTQLLDNIIQEKKIEE